MHSSEESINSQGGFSLIECMVAMVITMIGLLAVAGVIVVGMRMQTESRDETRANALAREKIEQLQNSSPVAAERARGGGLASNVANYNDAVTVQGVPMRRRWLIETHPADANVPANTQRVTIVILSESSDNRLPPVSIATLMPAS